MLQKFNERIQGLFAWVIIVLVALTFALFGLSYYMQSKHNTDVAVEVNGQVVSKQAFEASYRRHRQQHDASELTPTVEQQIKKQVIDDLVVNAVMVQAASQNGFEVTNNQALSAIESIPQFQEDGRFSSERYQQALNSAFFTPETFKQEVTQGMLLNQQKFAFMGTSFVLPNEMKRYVKLYMQNRDVDLITIPLRPFEDKVEINASEVDAYYKQYQGQFLTDEQVEIEYVALSLDDVKKDLKISDEEIQQYYEDNQGNYHSPIQWQVAHILFALPAGSSEAETASVEARANATYEQLKKSPAQFSELAKKVSDDKISAINDGKLPWLVAGQTEFDEALSDLKEPGQITAPVKTRHGFEIFKLIGFKPAEIKPFDAVKEQIQEQLLVEMAQAKFAESLEELSDVSYQSPDSLAPVAEALKLSIQHSAPFSRSGGTDPITSNKQVDSIAFSRDVLKLGNNSDPIQIDNNTVIVLRNAKHIAAKPMPVEDVKTTIIKKLKHEKAVLLAKEKGEQLIAQTNAKGKSATEGYTWKSLNKISRDSDEITPELADFIFSLSKVGVVEGKSLDNGDFVVAMINRINNGQLVDLDKEQQSSLAQQMESNLGMLDYDLYLNHLIQKADIQEKM